MCDEKIEIVAFSHLWELVHHLLLFWLSFDRLWASSCSETDTWSRKKEAVFRWCNRREALVTSSAQSNNLVDMNHIHCPSNWFWSIFHLPGVCKGIFMDDIGFQDLLQNRIT